MQLIKREPETVFPAFRSFFPTLRWDLDRFFEEFFGHRWPSLVEAGELAPPVELGETPEEIFVNVEVPGMNKEEIGLELADGTLTIKGEMKEPKEEKNRKYYRREFGYGRFARAIALPEEVEAEKVSAELENGVLRIHLPKTEKAKKHFVTVTVK